MHRGWEERDFEWFPGEKEAETKVIDGRKINPNGLFEVAKM